MTAVVWREAAYADLADIWVAASPALRERIEPAVPELNARLRENAATDGKSRSDRNRVTFAGPLAVGYRYEPEDDVAVVGRVTLFERSR